MVTLDVQLWLAGAQVIGVAISIFVLLEMRAQRRSSYRPRLTFDNQVIWLKVLRDGAPFATDKQEKVDYVYSMHDFALTLRNIGMGTAHQITVDWKYELADWKKQLLPQGRKYIEAVGGKSPQYFYTRGKSQGSKFGFLMNKAEEHRLNISNARPDTAVPIRFPETVLNAVCFGMHAAVRDAKRQWIIERDFPVLGVRFRYKDVGNRWRTNRMEIAIHARCYTSRQPYQLFGFAELAYSTRT